MFASEACQLCLFRPSEVFPPSPSTSYSLNSHCKGTLMYGTIILPQISGVLGKFPLTPPPKPPLSDAAQAPLSLQETSLGSTAVFCLWDAGQPTAGEWSLTQHSAAGR